MATLPLTLHLIAILPPLDIREDIKEMKEEIKSRFSSSHALKLPAHITIQSPFWVKETDSILLKDFLRNFSREQKPFPIGLDCFGSFPPRVIFVKISNHEPIFQLHEHLQSELPSSLFLSDKQRQLTIHPHLTIATRDLQENIFPQAWAAFKEKRYQADFIADELTLFRHNGKTWQREESFPFDMEI